MIIPSHLLQMLRRHIRVAAEESDPAGRGIALGILGHLVGELGAEVLHIVLGGEGGLVGGLAALVAQLLPVDAVKEGVLLDFAGIAMITPQPSLRVLLQHLQHKVSGVGAER